ncbi:MAG: LCP family protein [Clostridia bacterium]|nr:LCP family protein [Clostridia bacterium]
MESKRELRKQKKALKKAKRNAFTRLTKLYVAIAIIGSIAWFTLYKVNSLMGINSVTKVDGQGNTVSQIELVQDEPKKEVVTFLLGGTDESGFRTDTILYAKYDTTTNKLYMISIPRDTYTTNWRAYLKINSIYNGGKYTQELLDEVENLLAVDPIDYYMILNLEVISPMTDLIGGLEVNQEIRDIWFNFQEYNHYYFELPTDGSRLNAKQVENLVRYRSYVDGDISRGNMQKAVIKQLIKQMMSQENIYNLPTIISTAVNSTNTNVTVREAMKYVSELKEIDLDNIVSSAMPITNLGYYPQATEENPTYGQSCVLVNKYEARRIVAAWGQ